MASKLIYVVIVIVSVIGVTQNDQVPHLKGDILNRIGVSGWNIRGIEKVEKMFLEEETDPELEMMRRELLGSVLASYQICHDGVEDASRKMNSLLDYYDPDGIDGIKNLKEYEMEDNVEDLGEEKEDEKEEEGFLYDVEEVIALKDDLSDLFKPDESNRHLIRPTYVKDLEKFLHSINHACFSLSSALPHIHQNRKPRSPQKLVKRLAHSLSKWTERWVDTIESKFSTFMTNCLNQKVCKKYIEKLITNLIQISEENKKKIGKEPSGILEELLHDLSHTDTPSMESLSNFQKEVLKMGNSFEGFGKEEEDSFAMAEGISNGAEGKMGSNMDIYLGHRLSLLPALFKFSANGKDIAKQGSMNGHFEGDADEDEENEGSELTEIRFVRTDPTNLDFMYKSLNDCQVLHPDPEDQQSDDGLGLDDEEEGDYEIAENEPADIDEGAYEASMEDDLETQTNGNGTHEAGGDDMKMGGQFEDAEH